MLLPSFEYRAARSVAEAVRLLVRQNDAAILAGGTDLLPRMRAGMMSPTLLIDLKRIPGLRRIRKDRGGSLRIGAAVPLVEIASHPTVQGDFPILAECCAAVGAPPLRNRATLAGNICNASPAADTAPALLALEATLQVVGPEGRRSLPIGDFFLDPGKTALRRAEILTGIVLPGESRGMHGTYLRLSRRKGMDLATVGVLVVRQANPGAANHRVALVAVAPTPIRLTSAEELLDREGAAGAAQAAELAQAACRPIDDVRGSAQYRREMVGVLVRRAVAALGGGR